MPIKFCSNYALRENSNSSTGHLCEEIHKNKLTANVFSVLNPPFFDTGLDHGNIAEHPHVRRSIFKRDEFVVARFNIV